MKKNYLVRHQLNVCALALAVFSFVSCRGINVNPDMETPVVSLAHSADSPSTKVIIKWNKCEDAEGYAIEKTYMKDGVLEEEHFNYLSKDTTMYIDSNCEPGVEYTYTVGAGYFKTMGFFYGRVFGKTDERYSEPVSIKTGVDPLVCLDYPKNIKISEVEGKTNALELKWSPCENAVSYEIYCKCLLEDSSGNYKYYCTVDDSECILFPLYNETEYSFKIKALGESRQTSILSAPYTAVVPEAKNTQMDTAIQLQNGVTEKYRSSKESLWFIVAPQKGIIKIAKTFDVNAMIFTQNGELMDGCLSFEEVEDGFECSLKDANLDFVSGTKYLLRVVSPGDFILTIE